MVGELLEVSPGSKMLASTAFTFPLHMAYGDGSRVRVHMPAPDQTRVASWPPPVPKHPSLRSTSPTKVTPAWHSCGFTCHVPASSGHHVSAAPAGPTETPGSCPNTGCASSEPAWASPNCSLPIKGTIPTHRHSFKAGRHSPFT